MSTKEDFVRRFTSGQPTKYDKDKHIALLFDVFSQGKGVASFLNKAAIGKTTFYLWLKAHEEFKEAYDAAVSISQELWEEYPRNDPDFNHSYWSITMRNRFGYGKPRVRAAKDTTPLARIEAVWKGLEEGELGAQEATQLSSVITTQANIIANSQEEMGEVKIESVEDILAKVSLIQGVIDSNNAR